MFVVLVVASPTEFSERVPQKRFPECCPRYFFGRAIQENFPRERTKILSKRVPQETLPRQFPQIVVQESSPREFPTWISQTIPNDTPQYILPQIAPRQFSKIRSEIRERFFQAPPPKPKLPRMCFCKKKWNMKKCCVLQKTCFRKCVKKPKGF